MGQILFSLNILFQLDFQLKDKEGDSSSFIPNGEWALLGKRRRPVP